MRADPAAIPQAVLKNFAEAVGGRYHCYTPGMEVHSLPLLSFLPVPLCLGTWARTDHAVCLLPLPPPSSVGLQRYNQVKANTWEELGHEVTRDPLVNIYDELITHL